MHRSLALLFVSALLFAQAPHPIPGGYSLPNGWRITPAGRAIATEDLILNMTASKDERVVIAQHGGFNPHGLLVIDAHTEEPVQRIGLHSAWLGLAWSRDGSKLYVSGGNASGPKHAADVAPIYVFSYANGRLNEKPVGEWAGHDSRKRRVLDRSCDASEEEPAVCGGPGRRSGSGTCDGLSGHVTDLSGRACAEGILPCLFRCIDIGSRAAVKAPTGGESLFWLRSENS